jgi:hypothetical protein
MDRETMPTDHAESGAVRNRTRLVSVAGFVIDATTSADDGLLREFYSDYDRAFVLENEKEGYDGFAECLKLNHGDAYADLVKRYGPFREFVLVVRDPKTGARLGGANFIIFPRRRAVDESELCVCESGSATKRRLSTPDG